MKRKRIWAHFLLAAMIFFVFTTCSTTVCIGAAANADGIDDDKTLSPYFFVEGTGGSADSFPLKETRVAANVNGVIADVYVTQTYANQGSKPINASYVFPASSKVSVHGMKMEIGDKVVTAVIKERQEAKQEFEDAKSEGKSASLLEQQRPNVFSMNVANIMPGDTVSIELHYSELVLSTDGAYEFVFPTVVAPRYSNQSASAASQSDQWVASPYLKDGKVPPGKYNITVNLSTGIPISALACDSHDVEVNWAGESEAQITLSNPEDFAGNRDYILRYKLTGEDVLCGLMLKTGEEENFFLLMLQPPERVQVEDKQPREYIFVLDVSGSMDGFPLNTAKELLTDFLGHLKEKDRFNLVVFDDESKQMSANSVPAVASNIKKAFDMIEREFGGGGTELLPAMRRAVSIPMDKDIARSVVLITDGEIDAEQDVFDFIGKNLNNTNYFAFGIGSAVNRYLIDGVAKNGLGESFVATKPSEVAEVADRFRSYVESPVLTDVSVSYSGFNAYDVEPSSLPVLFAQRPIVLYGKWRGEPSGTIRITGKTASGDYVQDIQLSETKPLETNTAIGYLWARAKVESLMDYGLGRADEDAVKKEVTAIGLKYSMMTRYTSFVAVIDEVRNADKNSADVDQPLPLPLHVSNLAVGYGVGAEPSDIVLIAMMLFMMLLAIHSAGRGQRAGK